MNDNLIAAFFMGMLVGGLLLIIMLVSCGRTPSHIEAKWCAEMFAAPQVDTLAVLREHEFCRFPRLKP